MKINYTYWSEVTVGPLRVYYNVLIGVVGHVIIAQLQIVFGRLHTLVIYTVKLFVS